MIISEVEETFAAVFERVHTEDFTVDLERDDRLIARIVPVETRPGFTVGGWAEFLRSLPSLGDDTKALAMDSTLDMNFNSNCA